MKFQTTIDQPSMTFELPGRMMHVTIRDNGTITVHQKGRDVGPDEWDMGGDYELTLPCDHGGPGVQHAQRGDR